MARTQTTAEFNTFVKGLFTEASPLNFPEGASLDEDNMVLNSDGSRQRRRGLDFEDNYTELSTTVSTPPIGTVAYSNFMWENVGGIAEKSLSVVQIGNELRLFDLDMATVSGGEIFTKIFEGLLDTQTFSYATVDGLLVVATGAKEVTVLEYKSGSITETSQILYIRDLFGLEDVADGINLKELSNIEIRPTELPNAHLYNLRNQTFALPRVFANTETLNDPINSFFSINSTYPSNADTVIPYLHSDPNDADNRTIDRFFPDELVKNPPGTSRAPIGYFIIDAMERGVSRASEEVKLRERYSLSYDLGPIPIDTTPGGPSVVSEFAGRIWYGGFSAEVNEGDGKSPRMSSYLLFSRLIEDSSDINKCYQSGDPTTNITPDIIDTDGGFIRVDGAFGIQKMVSAGNSLVVVAANGVWRIYGGNDSGFSSTSYVVSKISENGSRGKGSILVVENTVIFWGEDGIYHVKSNEFGDWVAENITKQTIQSLYDGISLDQKGSAQGGYDKFERKVRWVYNNNAHGTEDSRELVFDVNLGAFYTNTIKPIGETNFPKVVSPIEVQPYKLDTEYSSSLPNSSGSPSITRQLMYIIVTATSPTMKFSFGAYNNEKYKDYYSFNDEGTDAEAYLVTGYLTAGDTQRNKQVPYLTCHFRRTETGFEVGETGDFVPLNQSSCIVQARWDWADSERSNRWTDPFQVYRYKRHYVPTDVTDTYDYGQNVITSKSKVRGKGKAFSLKFSTEPEKDMHLYGWSMIIGVTGNV